LTVLYTKKRCVSDQTVGVDAAYSAPVSGRGVASIRRAFMDNVKPMIEHQWLVPDRKSSGTMPGRCSGWYWTGGDDDAGGMPEAWTSNVSPVKFLPSAIRGVPIGTFRRTTPAIMACQ
jgi:hypothetical protein